MNGQVIHGWFDFP